MGLPDRGLSLGLSLTRYYTLEERAIRGLVDACAPRRRGPGQDPEREILKLKGEVKRLESQCRRTANLLRLSQRDLGLGPSRSTERPKTNSKNSSSGTRRRVRRGKRRRVRRGKTRALTLAEKLRSENPKPMDAQKEDGENPGEVKAD